MAVAILLLIISWAAPSTGCSSMEKIVAAETTTPICSAVSPLSFRYFEIRTMIIAIAR